MFTSIGGIRGSGEIGFDKAETAVGDPDYSIPCLCYNGATGRC
jgi:hypothetical protein